MRRSRWNLVGNIDRSHPLLAGANRGQVANRAEANFFLATKGEVRLDNKVPLLSED
jgi:hypothetical protein